MLGAQQQAHDSIMQTTQQSSGSQVRDSVLRAEQCSDKIKIEAESMFSAAASTSHPFFGNFIGANTTYSSSSQDKSGPFSSITKQEPLLQVSFLRSMNCIELYEVVGSGGSDQLIESRSTSEKATNPAGLSLICKYSMPSLRVLDMTKVTIDRRVSLYSRSQDTPPNQQTIKNQLVEMQDSEDQEMFQVKDLLVLHLPELKFLVLEFNPSLCEFGTHSLINLENLEELKSTGKRFPLTGMLQGTSSTFVSDDKSNEKETVSKISFITDDCTFCEIQFQSLSDVQNQQKSQFSAQMSKKGVLMNKQRNLIDQDEKQLNLQRGESQMWDSIDQVEQDRGINGASGGANAGGSIEIQNGNQRLQLPESEDFLNCMSGDPSIPIQQLLKPLRWCNLAQFGIRYVTDALLIEHASVRKQYLYVLYKGDINKMVGTRAKYPIHKLAIFEVLPSNMKTTQSQQDDQTVKVSADNTTPHEEKSSSHLKLLLTIETLPFYAQKIYASANKTDDFAYISTPYSVLVIRADTNRVTEIQLCTLAKALATNFAEDKQKMLFPAQTQTERSTLDFTGQELRLDGSSKIVVLPQKQLMVCEGQSGEVTVLTVKLDQAEIDVADVFFQKVPSSDDPVIASAISMHHPSGSLVSTDNQSIYVFLTSHFHDTTLALLQAQTQLESLSEAEASKRSKIASVSGAGMMSHQQASSQVVYSQFKVVDSLLGLSPVHDFVQIGSLSGQNSYENDIQGGEKPLTYSSDFILATGNHVKSSLNFASRSATDEIPFDKFSQLGGGDANKLEFGKVFTADDKLILVNYRERNNLGADYRTAALEVVNKQFVPVDASRLNLDFNSPTLAFFAFKIAHVQSYLQITPTSLKLQREKVCQEVQLNTDGQQYSVLAAEMDESQRVYLLRKQVVGSSKGTLQTSMKVFEITSEGTLTACVHIESVFEWIGNPITAFSLFSMPNNNRCNDGSDDNLVQKQNGLLNQQQREDHCQQYMAVVVAEKTYLESQLQAQVSSTLQIYQISPLSQGTSNSANSVSLVYSASHCNEQNPFIVNTLEETQSKVRDLTCRSMTDTSQRLLNSSLHSTFSLKNHATSHQLALIKDDQQLTENQIIDANLVVEIKVWLPNLSTKNQNSFPQSATPIVLLRKKNNQFDIYQALRNFNSLKSTSQESQLPLRSTHFKLVTSPLLMKPHAEVFDETTFKSCTKIFTEPKMAILMHPSRAMSLSFRQGRIYVHNFGRQGSSLASFAPFVSGFLGIDLQRSQLMSYRFKQGFDPRKASTKLTEGHIVKQLVFKKRGIKKLMLFNPTVSLTFKLQQAVTGQNVTHPPTDTNRYLCLATYQHREPANTGFGSQYNSAVDLGFTSKTKDLSIFYSLETYIMPDASKQISWMQLQKVPIQEEKFQENQIINQIEQLTLRTTQGTLRNYIGVASVRLETGMGKSGSGAGGTQSSRPDEEGFYSSSLSLYTVQIQQNKLKTVLFENYKRSITCLSHYLGKLIASMRNMKRPEHAFLMYTLNEQTSQLVSPQPLPNGVQNMATSISFDGDYILIGDVYKHISLLKKCDQEDNKAEKQDSVDLLAFKKVMSNKIDASCVGAFSLSKKLALSELDFQRYPNALGKPQGGRHEDIVPLTEIEKKLFTILTVATDGYLRIVKIREGKCLEIVAQINLMDKILQARPLSLNPIIKKDDVKLGQEQDSVLSHEVFEKVSRERKIAVVCQRQGIKIVSQCSEMQYRALSNLMEAMSAILPHRGAFAPFHAHLAPYTPFQEKNSLFRRLNSNAVCVGAELYQYYFLSAQLKEKLATMTGFSQEKLIQYLTQAYCDS